MSTLLLTKAPLTSLESTPTISIWYRPKLMSSRHLVTSLAQTGWTLTFIISSTWRTTTRCKVMADGTKVLNTTSCNSCGVDTRMLLLTLLMAYLIWARICKILFKALWTNGLSRMLRQFGNLHLTTGVSPMETSTLDRSWSSKMTWVNISCSIGNSQELWVTRALIWPAGLLRFPILG